MTAAPWPGFRRTRPRPLRLRVRKDREVGRWFWQLHTGPTTHFGFAPTHGEALAVGLAALEAASVGRPAG